MRLTTPSTRSLLEQRREQSRRKRIAAGTLANAFPQLSHLRIQLSFRDSSDRPPTRQVHELFPPAPAFFEFPCPHGDCDGAFDLSVSVSSLLAGDASRTEGAIECPGFRTAPAASRRPCDLEVRFVVTATYEAPEAATTEAR